MLKQILSILFLVLPAAFAQQIPGITLLNDTPFTFRNDSGKAIVALSVEFDYGASGRLRVYADGLDFPWSGVAAGGTVTSDPAHLNAGDLAFSAPDAAFAKGAPLLHVSIAWLMFADGDFYGSQKDAVALGNKARVRGEFFREVTGRLEPEKYVKTIEDCDVACMKGTGRGSGEWSVLKDAARMYRSYGRHYGGNAGQQVDALVSSHKRYPSVRLKSLRPEVSLAPDNAPDGWYISNYYATCNNGFNVFSSTSTIDQCAYATKDILPVDKQDEPISAEVGFASQFKADCDNYFGANVGWRMTAGLTMDKFNPASGGNVTAADMSAWSPWHQADVVIAANFNADGQGWIGDSVSYYYYYAYTTPYGVNANVDGGATSCAATDPTPFNNWPNPTGSAPLTLANTSLNAWNPSSETEFGFVLANFVFTQHCNRLNPATLTQYYPTVGTAGGFNPWVLYPSPGIKTNCVHSAPAVQAQGPSCNAASDWCCCLATYGSEYICLNIIQSDITPICDGVAYKTDRGMVALSEGRIAQGVACDPETAPDGNGGCAPLPGSSPIITVGVLRGQSLILDSDRSHSYTAGSDLYVPVISGTYAQQQPGDVAVTGDWLGIGRYSIGLYRPSTGQWFLDLTGDQKIGGSGDAQFNFGGLAGDVPVVGDWVGLGKTCVGIYRNGLWVLDSNCNRTFDNQDIVFAFGGAVGDVPVVGKWNGVWTSVGVVRCYVQNNACQGSPYLWVLDSSPTYAAQSFHTVWLTFPFGGIAGDKFVTGDWFAMGHTSAGVYRNGTWLLDDGTHGYNLTYQYGGLSGDVPIVGRW